MHCHLQVVFMCAFKCRLSRVAHDSTNVIKSVAQFGTIAAITCVLTVVVPSQLGSAAPLVVDPRFDMTSVAILAQEPFPVRTCTVFFPVHERFWFCLVQVSTNQFSLFPPVLMARYLPPLRIWVLLTALFLTSKEQDTVPVRWRRKSTKCS